MMVAKSTETLADHSIGLDLMDARDVARLLVDGQIAAANAVRLASDAIARAGDTIANVLEAGGRLFYAAAGSSGLMALADALEMPGTFGIPRDQIVVLIAGGIDALTDLAGSPEDDRDAIVVELDRHRLSAGDCLVALSASGSTPYAVAAIEEATRRGAKTVAIANNPGSPLLTKAQIAICLATPPEILAGSTRMGAGTAQKIALNMLSTLAAVRLGHVHDGLMVNLKADNAKLRDRAARIVAQVAATDLDAAKDALDCSAGAVKPAILIAAGASGLDAARAILHDTSGRLRPALKFLSEGSMSSRQSRS